jgi:hypothetical protein
MIKYANQHKAYRIHRAYNLETRLESIVFFDVNNARAYILSEELSRCFDMSELSKSDYIMYNKVNASYKGTTFIDKENIPYKKIFTFKQLADLHIKVLDYNSNGIDYAILKYLQDTYTGTVQIVYDTFEKQTLLDKTDRSILEIWRNGYRGNRLDLMVGSYRVYMLFPNNDSLHLGSCSKGQYQRVKDFYIDTIFYCLKDIKGFLMRK